MTLRAVVVLDYQNVHLTGRDVYAPGQDAHLALIHPMLFARRALAERNSRQRAGYPPAELSKVLVYRGLPHVDHDPEQNRRCQAQARRWRDGGAEVELRDLKYRHVLGADRRAILDIYGRKTAAGPGREKGIDVLVALACVREARNPEIDLVVLGSRDSDLVPVLDEISDMQGLDGVAKIETVSWFDKNAPGKVLGSLRPTSPRRIWNTNLGQVCFEASLDREDYT